MAKDISSLSSVLCSVEPCLIYKLIWNCIHFQDSLKTKNKTQHDVIQYSGKQCCVWCVAVNSVLPATYAHVSSFFC